MSASAWAVFIPYQEQFVQAVLEAQHKAFADGDFVVGWRDAFTNPVYGYELPADERPRNIAELLVYVDEWTYTYLSLPPDQLATYKPFSPARLRQIFGTAQPTRAMVDGDWDWNDFDGDYIVVYDDGKPVSYWLFGCDEHK